VKEIVVLTTCRFFSDSESDKHGKVSSRKHLLKPLKFDGKRFFEAFKPIFVIVQNIVSETEKTANFSSQFAG